MGAHPAQPGTHVDVPDVLRCDDRMDHDPNTPHVPQLADALALTSPEDNIRLYRDWARSYDDGFATAQEYRLPEIVADAFAAQGGVGPVLDFGAGTGLVGQRLARHAITPVDALDLSAEMLEVAAEKGVYRSLFQGNILAGLPDGVQGYKGIVSSGTFTLGHVGPEAIATLLAAAEPGALMVISVNKAHYEAAGFANTLAALSEGPSGRITVPDQRDIAIYGAGADPSHRDHRAVIISFRVLVPQV